MSFDFKGRRVVVTGASRGIGRSIALEFAAAGAAVSICARGADKLEATRQEIARHGGKTHGAVCDLADGADVARYVERAPRRRWAASISWSTTPRATARRKKRPIGPLALPSISSPRPGPPARRSPSWSARGRDRRSSTYPRFPVSMRRPATRPTAPSRRRSSNTLPPRR